MTQRWLAPSFVGLAICGLAGGWFALRQPSSQPVPPAPAVAEQALPTPVISQKSVLDDAVPTPVRYGLRANDDAKGPAGLWGSAGIDQEKDMLTSIGYASGIERPTKESGVHIGAKIDDKLVVWFSGHAPEAYVMNRAGQQLHRWRMPFADVWPDREIEPWRLGHQYWRKGYVFPNGDLLAIFDGMGMIKLDKDSNLIWAFDEGAHHDLEVMEDGSIWVLSRRGYKIDAMHPQRGILVDFVVHLDASGNKLSEANLLDAVAGTSAAHVVTKRKKPAGDILHTNTLHVIKDSTIKGFESGKILLSMRTPSTIMVFDPATNKVGWSKRGNFFQQHDPKLLENGHLLLFDNNGPRREHSVVREYALPHMRQVWSYRGTASDPFFSRFCGTAERLPNGNTLIVESSRGRGFEINPRSEIVWEFVNPHRAGDNDELIAIIPDMLIFEPKDLPFLLP